MDCFPFRVVCSVCGGEGVGNADAAAAEWIVGEKIVHTDPQVCADNLERKKKLLDKKEAVLNEKLAQSS